MHDAIDLFLFATIQRGPKAVKKKWFFEHNLNQEEEKVQQICFKTKNTLFRFESNLLSTKTRLSYFFLSLWQCTIWKKRQKTTKKLLYFHFILRNMSNTTRPDSNRVVFCSVSIPLSNCKPLLGLGNIICAVEECTVPLISRWMSGTYFDHLVATLFSQTRYVVSAEFTRR